MENIILAMNIFSIEYQILATGDFFLCKVLGNTEYDVITDIEAQVGKINVVSISRQGEINRITRKIKENIIELSLLISEKKRPLGRPKKHNFLMG